MILPLVHGIPIVHGDITSVSSLSSLQVVLTKGSQTNVLIDFKEGEYKACLTDFGLSTVLGGLLDDHTVEGSTVRHGAIKWTAPELLRMAHDNVTNIKPTEQNDMYSFGRVMFHVSVPSILNLI
jgi:serine/threonine protein kinase